MSWYFLQLLFIYWMFILVWIVDKEVDILVVMIWEVKVELNMYWKKFCVLKYLFGNIDWYAKFGVVWLDSVLLYL